MNKKNAFFAIAVLLENMALEITNIVIYVWLATDILLGEIR